LRQADVRCYAKMMFNRSYSLEFILHAHGTTAEAIRNSLTEFSEDLTVIEQAADQDSSGRDYAIKGLAEDPTVIFDICAQFGRIRSAKVEEKGD